MPTFDRHIFVEEEKNRIYVDEKILIFGKQTSSLFW